MSYVAQSFSYYSKRLLLPTQKIHSFSIPIHTDALEISKKELLVEHILVFFQ